MSEVVVDLSNYRDKTGARIKPGRYRVQVEDAAVDKSSTGNTMINLWFRVVGGDFNGSTLVDRLVLTEKSMFRLVGFMQALGMPTPRKRLKLNIRSFLGKTLEVDVDDGEPYRGTVRSEVRGYIRVAKTEDTSDIDDLDDGLDEDEDIEDVSDEPTDYDEDEEPKKAKAATKKKAKKAKKEPEPEEDEDDDEPVDLDDIEI